MIKTLQRDIQFTEYRLTFGLPTFLRAALEQRLKTLQQDLDAAPSHNPSK